jgi:hypothetical protein
MDDLATIDRNAVHDAYGPAEQAQDRINDLNGDQSQRNRAAEWIFGAVLHQGTPFPAITPLLRVIPRLLRDPAFAPGHGILIDAVRVVADGYELMTEGVPPDEQDEMLEEDPELAPYVMHWPPFLDAMRGMSAHIAPFLGSTDTELRARASACLTSLAVIPGASRRSEDRSRLAEVAARERDALIQAQLVHGHGRPSSMRSSLQGCTAASGSCGSRSLARSSGAPLGRTRPCPGFSLWSASARRRTRSTPTGAAS